MQKRGHTNTMAIYILMLLTVCIFLSFLLAVLSIKYQYMGALACWTVCFSPIGSVLGIVLNSTVNKSKAENLGPQGEGIRYSQIIGGSEPTI